MKDIGLKAGLDEAFGQELAEPRGQLPLLAEDEPASLPAIGPKVGRPRGSRNRRAREVAEDLIARFGSPLEGATRIAATDILAAGRLTELAQTLGCTRFEAAEWWRRVLDTVLPYLHQRQPQAVEVEEVQRITIIVGRAGDDARDVTDDARDANEGGEG